MLKVMVISISDDKPVKYMFGFLVKKDLAVTALLVIHRWSRERKLVVYCLEHTYMNFKKNLFVSTPSKSWIWQCNLDISSQALSQISNESRQLPCLAS